MATRELNDECEQWVRQVMHIIFNEGNTCFILSTSGINQSFTVYKLNGIYIVSAHILIGAAVVEFIKTEGLNLTKLEKLDYSVSIEC